MKNKYKNSDKIAADRRPALDGPRLQLFECGGDPSKNVVVSPICSSPNGCYILAQYRSTSVQPHLVLQFIQLRITFAVIAWFRTFMAIPVDFGMAVVAAAQNAGFGENMFEKYFLILFICYLPVYLALVFYLRTKIEGYSMRAHMVSYLATSDEPWRSVFNTSTILYGGLSLVIPFSLNTLFGQERPVVLGAGSLLATGFATVLIGFFPMDRKLKIHNAVGFFAFFSALFAGFAFLSIFNQGLLYSPLMEAINFAVIGTTLLLGLSLLLRRKVSSLLEWMAFLCTIAWNFLLATLLLLIMQ